MHRLLKKFDTAKSLVPQPVLRNADEPTNIAAIYFGSTSPAMSEAIEEMHADGIHLDTLRLRAFPFPDLVGKFIAAHERVFVVEQNRDAQLRSLLINEFGIDPAKLVPILHYDGTPITARFIAREIGSRASAAKVTPISKDKVASS
jgi:2-oxoglutarate ferredoxin oxidoreductase subunit alpha